MADAPAAAAGGGAPPADAATTNPTTTTQPPPRPYYPLGSRGALPSCWDARPGARHATATSYLRFTDGNLTARYVGPGEDDQQAASCRADRPIPSDAPFYYWELTVEDRGTSGFIGVGFCTEDVNLGRLPGWEPRSYGYHGDDGCAFRGSGRGWPYGPRFGAGDTVGALLDRAERSIRFFLNGQDLGVAFSGVSEERLYPMAGMRTRGESVRGNFGADPQRFPFKAADFWALKAGFVARAARAVAETALPGNEDGVVVGGSGAGRQQRQEQQQRAANGGSGEAAAATATNGSAPSAALPPSSSMPLMPALVFQYLMHHRCWRTASLVASEVLGMGGGVEAAAAAAAAAAGNGSNGNSGGGGEEEGPAPMELGGGAGGGNGDAPSPSAAAAAAAQVPESLKPDVLDAIARQEVCDAIKAGDLPRALHSAARALRGAAASAPAAVSPAAAKNNKEEKDDDDDAALVGAALGPHLLFRVRVQQFIEIVRAGDVDGALSFARGELGPAAARAAQAAADAAQGLPPQAQEGGAAVNHPDAPPGAGPAFWLAQRREDEELLQDALSLLAYEDPASSPCAHLLRPQARNALAERVNGALLARRGAPREPAVERLYRQATAALDELKRMADPRAMVLDADRVLREGLMALAASGGETEGGGGGGTGKGKAAGGGGGGGAGGAAAPAGETAQQPAAAAAPASAAGGAPSLMEIV